MRCFCGDKEEGRKEVRGMGSCVLNALFVLITAADEFGLLAAVKSAGRQLKVCRIEILRVSNPIRLLLRSDSKSEFCR